MITEDYVSFEIAKLLKEKGFDWETYAYWDLTTETRTQKIGIEPTPRNWNYKWKLFLLPLSAPTLQMTMKWLRNQHNLHIMVDCIGSKNYMPTIQFIYNSKDIKVESDKNKIGENGFDSFEEACEGAIKYCLENLI